MCILEDPPPCMMSKQLAPRKDFQPRSAASSINLDSRYMY